jgi:hypothetical protein
MIRDYLNKRTLGEDQFIRNGKEKDMSELRNEKIQNKDSTFTFKTLPPYCSMSMLLLKILSV